MINADLEARTIAFTHDHKALALGRVDGRERRHGAGEHLGGNDLGPGWSCILWGQVGCGEVI